MITFSILGSLPVSWEDFFSGDPAYPNVTIMTAAEAADCDCKLDDPNNATPDGWLDIEVDVDVIDLDVARLAIADALGIDNPEDVVIDQRRICQSF